MNDIVERLREYVYTDSDRYAKDGAMLAAADEIEKLRKQLQIYKKVTTESSKIV